MTAIDTVMAKGCEQLAHPGPGREHAQAGDEEARHQGDHLGPGVCQDQHGPYHGDGGQGAPSRRLATEPEHDHQPQRDRGEVRDLHRGDRPELTGEPTLVEGTAGGHHEAEEHRAEHYPERL